MKISIKTGAACVATACSAFLSTGSVAATPLEDMISPINHPVTFEDPRATTEARLIYVHHKLDDDFVTSGGDVNILALQLRYAITDYLAFIATKDGWVDLNPDEVVAEDEGWANVAFGFKFAFFKDDAAGQIATIGLRYEAPVGDEEVLQGNGDGNVNPFFSGAMNFGNINLMVGTGARMAIDQEDSSLWDLDLHADYKIDWFYPTLEVGMIHVYDAGQRLPIADEGEDFFNLGATESEGKTLVTGAIGARARLSDNVDLGVAYEIPLTNGAGSNINEWRLTTDLIVRLG